MIHQLLPLLFAQTPDPVKNLYGYDQVWLPSSFATSSTTWATVTNLSSTVFTKIGMAFVVILTAIKYIQYFSERRPVRFGSIVFQLIPSLIMGVLISSFTVWNAVFHTVILGSAENLITAVKTAVLQQSYANFMDALDAASATNFTIGQHLTSIFSYPITLLMLIFATIISLCLAWAINLYISVMWTLLFIIGPALFPFVIYSGTESIGWTWLKSFLTYSFMGMVGALIQGLLFSSGLLTYANAQAGAANVVTGIASAAIFILCMVMVPSITASLFGGATTNPFGIAMAVASQLPAAKAIADVTKGVAAKGAGSAASRLAKRAERAGNTGMAGRLTKASQNLSASGSKSLSQGLKRKL
jgi:hypothetical protein